MTSIPFPWRHGDCTGGRCSGATNCIRHAALYERHVMLDRGWVAVLGLWTSGAVSDEFWAVARAVSIVGGDLQRGVVDWDDARGAPVFGVWAPRWAAMVLEACTSRRPINPDLLRDALNRARVDRKLADAMDAAYRMGGKDAALQVILSESTLSSTS